MTNSLQYLFSVFKQLYCKNEIFHLYILLLSFSQVYIKNCIYFHRLLKFIFLTRFYSIHHFKSALPCRVISTNLWPWPPQLKCLTSQPLPVTVTAEVLGIPTSALDRHSWSAWQHIFAKNCVQYVITQPIKLLNKHQIDMVFSHFHEIWKMYA